MAVKKIGEGEQFSPPIPQSQVQNLETDLADRAKTTDLALVAISGLDSDISLNTTPTGNLIGLNTQEEVNNYIDALIFGGGGGTVQNANGSMQPAYDGTIHGNDRGINAIDFQLSRTLASQVASGEQAVLIGGMGSTAPALRSAIYSGYNNTLGIANSNTALFNCQQFNLAPYRSVNNSTFIYVTGQSKATASYSLGMGNAISMLIGRSQVSGGSNGVTRWSGQNVLGLWNGRSFDTERQISHTALQLTTVNTDPNQVMTTCPAGGSSMLQNMVIPSNSIYLIELKIIGYNTTTNEDATIVKMFSAAVNSSSQTWYDINAPVLYNIGAGVGSATANIITASPDRIDVFVSPSSADTILWQAFAEIVHLQE